MLYKYVDSINGIIWKIKLFHMRVIPHCMLEAGVTSLSNRINVSDLLNEDLLKIQPWFST